MSANTSWDAATYERIGTPMRGWAQAVIDDLALTGAETVLDAGCGSGSVTFDLHAKLPRGRIYAVDASAEMIASLTAQIKERGVTNIMPIHAGLTDFALPEQVDRVFSNAVFHWIPDDAALFGCLLRAAKPGGQLRAQCGGFGNNANVLAAVAVVRRDERFAPHLGDFQDSKKYRTPEQAKAALEAAGWADVRANLWPQPVPFATDDDAALYVKTILLRDHIARLPGDLGDAYARAIVAETKRARGGDNAGDYIADYVRLDLWATRPA